MKRLTVLALALGLVGCESMGYRQYADAMAQVARYRAEAQEANAKAISALATTGDATTRTVAVIMLALQQGQGNNINIAPPQNEALQWAQVILPAATTLGMGYWGYKLGQTQSNNAAAVSIAGYGAMGSIADSGFNAVGQFKPVPFDWSGLAKLQPNVTITNQGNGVIGDGSADNRITNQGNGVIGDGSVDNRITNPDPTTPAVAPLRFGP